MDESQNEWEAEYTPHLRIAELRAENQRLREALQEAALSVDEYAHYAGEYLRNKHRIDDDIAEWQKLAEGE